MSFGPPGPLQTAFELKKRKNCVKYYSRRGYTNVTRPYLAKKTENIKVLDIFPKMQKKKNSKSGGLYISYSYVSLP